MHIQEDNYSSAGYVILCIRGLNDQLSKMMTKYHSSFVTALQTP